MKLKYHVTPGDTIQTELGVGLVTAVEVTKFVGFDLGSTELVSVIVNGSFTQLHFNKEMVSNLEERTIEVDERYTGGREILECKALIKTPFSCDLALRVRGRKGLIAIKQFSLVSAEVSGFTIFHGLLGAEVTCKWHDEERQGKVQSIILKQRIVTVNGSKHRREVVRLICKDKDGKVFRPEYDSVDIVTKGEDCALPRMELSGNLQSISVNDKGVVEYKHKLIGAMAAASSWCKLTKEEMVAF